MRAAAAGESTLGIPKSVGAEFSEADEGGKLPKKKKPKSSSGADYGKLVQTAKSYAR
jgi:hypothetical protein